MTDISQFAQTVFNAQPFSRFLGARLIHASATEAEIHLPLTDTLRQQHGFAHGGVLSYLADNSITFAGGLALGADALTSEYKINYLRPASGDLLIACARPVHTGKRQAVCLCEVFVLTDGQQKLCALAQGTVVALGTKERSENS